MAFTILPPSFGRRCPEGAVVGFRSGLKRNEKMRFLLSSSCHARPPVSTVSESHDLLAGHANQKRGCEEMGIHFFTAPFYSKFRMRAPHDLDAILPEDTCKCFDLLAQLLISPHHDSSRSRGGPHPDAALRSAPPFLGAPCHFPWYARSRCTA